MIARPNPFSRLTAVASVVGLVAATAVPATAQTIGRAARGDAPPLSAGLVSQAKPDLLDVRYRGRHFRGRGWRGGRHYYGRRHGRHYGGGGVGIAAGIAALIIGGAIANSQDKYHGRWERCDNRYKSFRWSDGTFQPYGGGPRQLCPYLHR